MRICACCAMPVVLTYSHGRREYCKACYDKKQTSIDIQWAFWVSAIIFFFGFMVGRASACESCEECIGWQSHKDSRPNFRTKTIVDSPNKYIISGYETSNYQVLKAIAYKLDSIDKKLAEFNKNNCPGCLTLTDK